jgi:hypothetical protein
MFTARSSCRCALENPRIHADGVNTLPRSTLGRTTLALIVFDWFMLVAAGLSRVRRRRAHRRLAC